MRNHKPAPRHSTIPTREIVDVLNEHADGCDLREPSLQHHARCLRAAAERLNPEPQVKELPDGSFEITGELAEWLHDFAKFAGVKPSAAFNFIVALNLWRIMNQRKATAA